MKLSQKKAPFASFAWTIVLIIVLASFAFLTILTNSKSEAIRHNIQALNQENTNYHKIDTSISLLYVAENNSRLFVVTADSSYLKAYRAQLNSVLDILTRFEAERKKQSSSFSTLINRKNMKNEEFVNLKMMLDSLISFSEKPPVFKKIIGDKPSKITRSQQIEKTDSVILSTNNTRKRLLKRIAEAIANKESDTTTILHSGTNTITIQDSINVHEPAEEIIDSNINDRFYQARRDLNTAELRLLKINDRIFLKIQTTLKELKAEEKEIERALKSSIISATSDKFEDVHHLSWGNIFIVLTLATMIISNILKLYKNGKTIIQYANLTAETSKKKGAFLAQVAHEIRTPLNSIIGFSQLIDTHNLEENLRININAIKSSSRILLALVNEILDFSKFESGRITLLNKNFQPVELVNDAIAILSVLAAEKQITISTKTDLDSKTNLTGDDFRIKQVVINLLTNAVKFTPKKGFITIGSHFTRTGDEKGILEISVKDSGVGIAKEDIETIFDDFIQIESVDSSSPHLGTGLGLAICKRIVDLYEGQISVKSAVGKGSEFKVSLPLNIAPKISTEIGEHVHNQRTGVVLEGKKLLLVDDKRINLLLLSKILDKHGITYDQATDGKKAYKLFEINRYDLIITDINMPEMGGVELTGLIRQNPDIDKSATPILAFTGSSTKENKEYYNNVGMNDILEKPFEESQLIVILNRLL